MLVVKQIPVLSDNYVYLVHDADSGATAVVDPAVALPVLQELEKHSWQLTHLLNTHHHPDHVGGNLELKSATSCIVVGPKVDKHRIPGIDICVSEGDSFALGSEQAQILDVPGHTRGHNAYWFEKSDILFCGDALFALGCGRMFEGTAQQMWGSIQKIKALPKFTKIYCAHEYTQANADFALSIDANNRDLQQRKLEIDRLRKNDLPTVPSLLDEECKTNPFLRTDNSEIKQSLNLKTADEVTVFAEMRRRKDHYS